MQKLNKSEIRWRFTCLALLSSLLLVLGIVPPGALPKWFPFATSCGAISGLPCIFCGMTRAVHHLLHGEFGQALYYNWLAFPFAAGAVGVAILSVIELILDRNLFALMPPIRLTQSSLGATILCLILLWCLQVYLAVSQHKTELLNPNGPLYSLVVH